MVLNDPFSRTALIDPEIQLSAQRLSTRFSFFGLVSPRLHGRR
jgi:hypothetical protein